MAILNGKEIYSINFKDELREFFKWRQGNRLFYGINNGKIPYFDMSGITSCIQMFEGCTILETLPQLNFREVINASYMCQGCTNLRTVPEIYFSNAKYVHYMFKDCTSLTTAIIHDTGNAENFAGMFENCGNLTDLSLSNTNNGKNFSFMFNKCKNLITIPQLDLSNATNVTGMFANCSNLQNITFTGEIPISIVFTSTSLTVDSLLSIINALKDLNGSTSQTLLIGETNITKLTTEQLQMITNKNWTYA